MAKIDELFKLMVDQGASDLHLSAGSPPILRLHGEMHPLETPPYTNEQCQALIFEILSEKHKKEFVEKWELDTSYFIPNVGRFRINVFMQRRGMGGVFRVIPEKIKSMTELGLPDVLYDMINCSRGLILVTGPTGSGKSTTLAAMIDHINTNEKSHILTIEDPVEFVHQNKMSLINQREVSSHTKSFSNALKASLREDPDIILVGEMRDLETIQLALTAAETGHLVFGTLHTNNTHKTVDRIIDVFPEGKHAQIRTMLSESLRGVVSQSLLTREGGGRVAALEILMVNKAVANLIREGKTFQIPSTMQTGRGQGMQTYEMCIDDLLKRKLISTKTANEFLGKTEERAVGSSTPTTGTTQAFAPVAQKSPAYTPPPTQPPGGTSVANNLFKKTS
jgi:twitching motility protein PilT